MRQVNAQRLQRAVILMSEKQRIFFEQLPVLLHFNHPLLPGYIQDAPCGIEHFELSRYQQSYIDELCSATGYSGLADPGRRDIMSVYSMGSTGSIGQNSRSDLDIWVCHSHDMSKRGRFLLEQKCGIISNVAAGRGVEVNFFLVPDDKFTGAQEESSTLSSEDCGSAQRLLLLDEFYRSALHIAGRWLVWYLVPDEYDTIDRYDRCVAGIMSELGSGSSDWFDLGTCNTISAEEFFGSALWLIYKGIHSPYKAVLKILLTEAYSAEFPETRLISQIVRRHCQLDSAYSNQMDPYYQTFMKVRGYLGARNDSKRMELAAGSFYLKMTDGLSPDGRSTADSFRRAEVEEFIRDGNISEATRRYVDGRSRWRISDVRLAYHVITETLMQSYRFLGSERPGSGHPLEEALRLVQRRAAQGHENQPQHGAGHFGEGAHLRPCPSGAPLRRRMVCLRRRAKACLNGGHRAALLRRQHRQCPLLAHDQPHNQRFNRDPYRRQEATRD